MNDLISRKELLKRFCLNKDGNRIPERDCDNFEITMSIKDIKAIIKEQPTAYDVDKVVEQLQKLSDSCWQYADLDRRSTGKARAFDKAIEIVESGRIVEEDK